MDYKKRLQQTTLSSQKQPDKPKPPKEPNLDKDQLMDTAEVFTRQQLSKGRDVVDIYIALKTMFGFHESDAKAMVDSVRFTGTPEWNHAFCYVAGTGNKTSLQLDEERLLKTLIKLGYRRYMQGDVREGYITVQVIDNVVYERNIGQIKAEIQSIVKKLAVQVEIDEHAVYRSEIFRCLLKMERSIFTPAKMEWLPDLSGQFLEDTETSSFFVFQSGYVEVTATDPIKVKPLKGLPGLVWEAQVIQRSFDTKKSPKPFKTDFYRFVELVSGGNEKRSEALRTAIGYLLHRYRREDVNKAVILMDEQVSSEPNGGTGKSMIGKWVNLVRPSLWIDGRNFRWDKSFAFQRYRPWHSVMVFDDVPTWFKFEPCYVILTQGLTVERKGKDEKMVEYRQTPKLLITTNYVVGGIGQSNERRRADYEISPYFNSGHQPKDEFKRTLLSGNDPYEWAAFDMFMLTCCQEYLSKGLLTQAGGNKALRMLIQATEAAFPAWMEQVVSEWAKSSPDGKCEARVPKDTMYTDWLNTSGWSEKDLSRKKWKSWLEAFAKYKGATVESLRDKSDMTGGWYWFFQNLPKAHIEGSKAYIGAYIGGSENDGLTFSESDNELPF